MLCAPAPPSLLLSPAFVLFTPAVCSQRTRWPPAPLPLPPCPPALLSARRAAAEYSALSTD
eukprot:2150632-Heterocapsa_arctica.AAC.1